MPTLPTLPAPPTCDERGVGAHVGLDVGAHHPLNHLLSPLPLAVRAQGCRRGAVRVGSW